MSLSVAMSNAVFGLRAAGRGAEVVSTNISNALTPGYGRRSLELASAYSGGVRIAGVTRHVDAGLASDRRLADAASSFATQTAEFSARFEELLGAPNDPSSMSARLASFEAALVTASSRPDAEDRLGLVLNEARGLSQAVQAASDGIQASRTAADRTIAGQVDTLNLALQMIQDLNAEITGAQASGDVVAGLEDRRQILVDQIGEIVPVRVLQRQEGQIALYSTNGAVLIDGSAATIEFSPTNLVTPYMTLGAGTLSGLTVNGQAISADPETGGLGGGSLGAQFAIRDELGVAAQTELDAFAQDLIERFQDPAVDSTLALGDAGFFTDEGLAFAPGNEVGLAARLEINAAVDPAQGGEIWRIRDGVNAVAEGPVGDASLLQSLTAALTETRPVTSGSFAGNAYSASDLTSAILSQLGVDRGAAEQRVSFTASRLAELTERQLAEGVDTDSELQRLIQIEQSYAANARMIEVLDEMMDILNRL